MNKKTGMFNSDRCGFCHDFSKKSKPFICENCYEKINTLIQEAKAPLLQALKEIAKGEGAYDTDQLKHASNTIDNMKEIANKAIKGKA